jgi:hypothetical protein
MEIVDFEPGLREEWDAFVAKHPLAGFGHLSGNFALAGVTDGVRNLSLVAREGRQIAGILPLFARTGRVLRSVAVTDMVSGAFFPAGPLISPAAKGKAETNVLTALLEAARARAAAAGADRIVIAYPNVTGGQPTIGRAGYSPLLHHGYRARPAVGLLLDLTQTAEQLGAGRKSGCRQSIAKAQASGATVDAVRDRDEWMACYEMNVQTLGELAHSEVQLAAIWDHFIQSGQTHAYAVRANGVTAAVAVTIESHGTAYYWHGWRANAQLPGASHLALWTAILAARDRGCRAFELGSLEFEHAKNIGISQFKQSFGGTAFQTMAAACELRPVKSAAIALADAALAAVRQRRRRPAPAAAVSAAAKPAEATQPTEQPRAIVSPASTSAVAAGVPLPTATAGKH